MKTFIAIPNGKNRDSFLTKENMDQLRSYGEICEVEGDLNEDSICNAIGDCEVYMTLWGSARLSKKILDSAPNLKLLVHLAGTVAPFVSKEMWDRGIKVISGNSLFAMSTAEGTLAYILSALRDIPFYSTNLKEKREWKNSNAQSYGLIGKTVGIVSYGSVAQNLIKMLQAFNVKILVYDIIDIANDENIKYNLKQVSLEELFSNSDIISVHTPLNSSTKHLINKDLLKRIRPGGLFVNTSRGEVIDQVALETILKDGKIKAMLDVFDIEPLPQNSKLFELENLMLMPHMAGPTTDFRPQIATELIKEAYNYISFNTPLSFEITEQHANNMSVH